MTNEKDDPGKRPRWGANIPAYGNPAPAVDPEAARLDALKQQAYACLENARADLAQPFIAELARALPDDKWVKHMVRQAPVIAFERPMERAALVLEKREPPASANVDLVAFHVALPVAPSGIHQAIDYSAVLALSFESARIKAPAARRILITDETTVVAETIQLDEVLRFPLDKHLPMYERMRAQRLYLGRREPGRASVLMDSDIVVNQDPAAIFTEDFDVALTWRAGLPEAPFNGGMILIAEGSQGEAFFESALACYDAIASDPGIARVFSTDLRAWWGDQYALAAMVGYREFRNRTAEAMRVGATRMRFFPCDSHNFTLEPGTRYPVEELRRKRFIHFKGNRKELQVHYLENLRSGRI